MADTKREPKQMLDREIELEMRNVRRQMDRSLDLVRVTRLERRYSALANELKARR